MKTPVMETKDMKIPVRVTIDFPWLSESIVYEFNGDTGKMHIEVNVPAEPKTASVTCSMSECFWPETNGNATVPSSAPNR